MATPATAEVFGVLGDSLSDEYLGLSDGTETDLPAFSWVQVLAVVRGLDFGTLDTNPLARPEPRNKGYARVWARAGGTANPPPFFMPAEASLSTQAPGLAADIVADGVDIVTLQIGHNDYYYRDMVIIGFQPVSGTQPEKFILDDPAYLAFEDNVFNNIFAAVDTVRAANPASPPKFLLGYLPKASVPEAPYLIPAFAQINARLTVEVAARAALGQEIKIIDMWAFENDPDRFDESGNLLIGPFALAPDSKASLDQTTGLRGKAPGAPCTAGNRCSTLEYTLNMVCHDEPLGHPGTILQGLLANEVLKAINPWLTTPVELLSDTEIILAGAPESCPDDDVDTLCDWDDLCPGIANPSNNEDTNGDGIGDACQCGDVDGSGSLDSADAAFIHRASLGLYTPPFVDLGLCDVDNSGTCDSADAAFVHRGSLGLYTPPFVLEVCDVMP